MNLFRLFFGLWLSQNLICRFGQFLTPLLHLRAGQNRLLVLGHGLLLLLQLIEPRLKVLTGRQDLLQLLTGDMTIPLARRCGDLAVAAHVAAYPAQHFLATAGLFTSRLHRITQGLQLVEFVDELDLCSIKVIEKPVFGLLKLLLELLPIIWRDKGHPVAPVPNLGAGIEDVALQVIFPLIGFDDFSHFCLHLRLLILPLLQDLWR
mmetsp:Transcript_49054/g.106750  ORF Transcript_49054/g.106750 Transcript_49054/m.106750 type:complete len:206 (+) Transcript_49054:229-846(+)